MKKYDLSGLSGAELAKAQDQIRVENPGAPEIVRPEGKDANTYLSVSVGTSGGTTQPGSTQGAAGTVTIDAPVAKIGYLFQVFWASPNLTSKAGDGTLGEHEDRHANATIGIVNSYNSASAKTVLPVSSGSGGFDQRAQAVVNRFANTETAKITEQLRAAHAAIDNY